MNPTNRTPTSHAISRRRFLATAATVAAVGIAACDDPDVQDTSKSSNTSAEDSEGNGATETTSGSPDSTTPADLVKRGGTLKIGVIGDTNDIIDGQHAITKADQVRLALGFEPLAHHDRAGNLATQHGLADTIDMIDAGHYTITIKPHATFSDGTPVTAEDAAYSIRRRIDPTSPAHSPSLAALITPESVTTSGNRTIDIVLDLPNVTFLDEIADYTMTLVPDGYAPSPDDLTTQVGTGPFVLTEFIPGQHSVHRRNPNYWWSADHPYLDEVHILDYPDQTALITALADHHVDVIIDVPHGRATEVAAIEGISLLDAPTGSWVTITMAIDQAPFDNPDVRHAMRLIANRQALIDTVVHGHGTIANDLYSPLDRDYANDIPQHNHEPDTARQLLSRAGHTNLTLELFTPDDTPGLTELATAYAAQAADAGVTITVTTLPGADYWGTDYTHRAFATDYWPTRPYLTQAALSSLPNSPYNTTHWPPPDSEYTNLYQQATTSTSARERHEIVHQMQRAEWEAGGHIIPFFHHLIDAHTNDLKGLNHQPTQLNLNHYGRGMKTLWLDRE